MAYRSDLIFILSLLVLSRSWALYNVTSLSVAERSRCVDLVYASRHPDHAQLQLPNPNKEPLHVPQDCADMINEIRAEEKRIEEMYIKRIAAFPISKEKRVISFGLYGEKPKYVHGAMANIKLGKIYYPEWVCSFLTSEVPSEIIKEMKAAGAEVVEVADGKDMLARFEVAQDATVDRFIIRDIDSRLNHRERFAVQMWIDSGMKIHTMRDHINHQYEYNGGMWGAVKGAVPLLVKKIKEIPKDKRSDGMIDIETLASVWKRNR